MWPYYLLNKGKIEIITEGNMLYIVWEPDITLEKQEFESVYSYGTKDLGDIVANIIYNKNFADDYYLRHYTEALKEILDYDDIGITPEELVTYPDREIFEVITETKAYHKLKKFYDYNYSSTPKYELYPEVHKRLKNRNCIPIMFWDSDKDTISWANDRLYGNGLMTKKNRGESSLKNFTEDSRVGFSSKCHDAMMYAPLKQWGTLLVKNPETGNYEQTVLR
jgi:hypothetical protein